MANKLQWSLIMRYAARHQLHPEIAARLWISRHAAQFRAWFNRHKLQVQQ